ncbi:MAG: hypothetical protein AAF741_12745 [Bacteroidota bacterium]
MGLMFGLAHLSRGDSSYSFWKDVIYYGLAFGLAMPFVPILFGRYVERKLDMSWEEIVQRLQASTLNKSLVEKSGSLIELKLNTTDVHRIPAEVHWDGDAVIFVGSNRQYRAFRQALSLANQLKGGART